MAERIEIELDELTSAYLRHYARNWSTDLSEVATVWLRVQATAWEFREKVAAEVKERGVPDGGSLPDAMGQ